MQRSAYNAEPLRVVLIERDLHFLSVLPQVQYAADHSKRHTPHKSE
jgi:hypothetical protein